MIPDPHPLPPTRSRRLIWAALLVTCAAYVGSFLCGGYYKVSPVGGRAGYYGLLTEALVSGQLSLKVAPDPRLAQLANPYLGYQGIPRMHDATYFKGKYYIYFGVAPVIILYGPWRLATGTYLAEGAGTLIFTFAGFLLGLAILRDWVRREKERPAPAWLALGILGWGLGTYAFAIAQESDFYAVPILSAFMLVIAALFAAMRALRSAAPGRAALWLAAASAAWGLAVASRPHFVFSLPLLALPAAWLLGRDRCLWARGHRGRLIAALLVPAAVVGGLLAGYNYARFGSVAEFGFHYQFTAGDQRFIQLWNPALILPNLRAYLFNDGVYSVYFPFVTQITLMQGAFAFSPFAILGLLFPLTLLIRRRREDPVWTCLGLMALGAALIHLLALSILPIGADRYDVDFDPEFSLAAGGTALAILALSRSWRPGWRRLARSVLGLLAVIAIGKCSFYAAQRLPNAEAIRRLGVVCNYPVAWVQQALGGLRGPIKLEVSFNRLQVGQNTNLVETSGGRDSLFVRRIDAATARLGFVHLGNVPTYGTPFPISRDGHQVVVIDLGSLYPPDTHRIFSGWSKAVVDAMHQRVAASVDGRTVFSGNSDFYPSDPFHVLVGEVAPRALDLKPFPGPTYRVSHLHIPTEAQFAQAGWHGDVRLHFKFPAFSSARSEPLLSTGATDQADMIYVTYLGKGRARFGHDSADGGNQESAVVTFDPAVEHTLDVGLGSLEAPPGTTPPDSPGLRLAFDGSLLISMALHTHASEPYQVAFGFNSGHLSTAEESFGGGDLRAEPLVFPEFDSAGVHGTGPISITVQFAAMPSGVNEPLVVSGVSGKGDIVYIHYVDATHALIGLDHWAVGARQSAVFPLVGDAPYTLTVTSAAFLPPKGDPRWGAVPLAQQKTYLDVIRVSLNGREILVAPWPGYPARDNEITLGRNSIGGSTTGPVFTGKILERRRDPLPGANATRGGDNAGKARP